MPKFLLNANLSPKTASFLRDRGLDVKCLLEENLETITDEEVVSLAKNEERIIITFDLDFGQIYHFRERGKVGIIVLRLNNQTVESANAALDRFFKDFEGKEDQLKQGLIVVEEEKYRIHQTE